jgi:enamine deaminase RidA (YjgF/YER057c/UK114 family)
LRATVTGSRYLQGTGWFLLPANSASAPTKQFPQIAKRKLTFFANIAAILAEDDMTLADVIRINAYVTDREYMQGYMRSRDRQFQGTPPASTLMIVKGFTKPEFLVEIEVVAAAPERD